MQALGRKRNRQRVFPIPHPRSPDIEAERNLGNYPTKFLNGSNMSNLPSTTGLRVFEAAARLLNFTRAAKELGLTQGAVSHQIRELEELLGTRLFNRRHRGLSLTEEGRIYLVFARDAIDRMRAGSEALNRRDAVLTVAMSPTFAGKWMAPRLGDFAASHPDIDLRISASRANGDFSSNGVDLAVRRGDGDWDGLNCRRICEEEIFPVCGKSLLTPGTLLERPDDLRRHVLLHDRDRTGWTSWLTTIGVATDPAGQGPVFDDAIAAMNAAIAGQGVALAPSVLASHDLAGGRLVRPLAQSVPASSSYWTVCPENRSEEPKILAFRAWLSEQASAPLPAPGPRGGR